MKKYNPNLVDEYIKHLIETAKQQRCYAAEDIYNNFGVLLIKKGEEITGKHNQALNNHQLNKPVDESFTVEGALTEKGLLEDFLAFFESQAHLHAIHTHNNFEKALEHLCLKQGLQPILFQKLTVLKNQFPKEYEITLFCAWFSALLAKRAEYNSETILTAFSAGLFSNLGLLHIPEEVANDKTVDKEAYQTHPIISSLIARSTKRASKDTCLATAEHHESLYGEGFPHSKNIATLSPAGLALSTANFVLELCQQLPQSQRYNLNAALPHMRIHNALNANAIFSGALKAIVCAGIPPIWQGLNLDNAEYNQYLLDKTLTACELTACITLLNKVFSDAPKTKPYIGIILRLQRTVALLHSTGLSTIDVVEMLIEAEEYPLSIDEMIEMDLMQAEFFYAAKFLNKQLMRFSLKEEIDPSLKKVCTEQIALMVDLIKSMEGITFFQQLKTKEEKTKEFSIA